MSRTLKDRPEWVQRFDPANGRRVKHDHRLGLCRVETLADARLASAGARGGDMPSCTLERWGYVSYCMRFGHGVPEWFIHARWTGPDRRRVRDACRAAEKELYATGAIEDTELPAHSHRHDAGWLWY